MFRWLKLLIGTTLFLYSLFAAFVYCNPASGDNTHMIVTVIDSFYVEGHKTTEVYFSNGETRYYYIGIQPGVRQYQYSEIFQNFIDQNTPLILTVANKQGPFARLENRGLRVVAIDSEDVQFSLKYYNREQTVNRISIFILSPLLYSFILLEFFCSRPNHRRKKKRKRI